MATLISFDVTRACGMARRPYVTVRLLNPTNRQSIRVLSIFDTGADVSSFDSEVARALGVDLSTGRPSAARGFQGASVPVVFVPLIQVVESSASYGEVMFRDDASSLLGRIPMMERMRFGFRQAVNQFYLANSP